MPASCMFGSETLFVGGSLQDLPNTNPLLQWKCGTTQVEQALIGIGGALAVLYGTMLVLESLGNDCNPRSFSAIAAPNSTTERHTILTQLAVAVCSVLMRKSEALWGRLLTPVILFLLSVRPDCSNAPWSNQLYVRPAARWALWSRTYRPITSACLRRLTWSCDSSCCSRSTTHA